MTEFPKASGNYSPDRALPPVQAPTTGFLVQLFVIPGLIVLAIVLVWLLFNWLAHMGSNPQAELAALKLNNAGRWQSAYNLSEQLRQDQAGIIRGDPKFAAELAGVLETSLAAEDNSGEAAKLRIFLCQALGMFTVDQGVPALIKAAETAVAKKDPMLHNVALEALANTIVRNEAQQQLAKNANSPAAAIAPWPRQERILGVLQTAAANEDLRVRTRAAYVLGEFSSPAAAQTLTGMLYDKSWQVRFNAATSLAKRGDVAAIPVLVEMLEIQPRELVDELPPANDNWQSPPSNEDLRRMVVKNGLQATLALRQANSAEPPANLMAAIERLTADPDRELADIARDTQAALPRAAPAEAK
ncbi:MAG: HEAT repeat domain-containing protein [Pirellulales bacterium]|nr:HEAT repeat domain-containing protein [Pirellulales bacterium]